MKRNNAVDFVRIYAACVLLFMHLMEFFGNAKESMPDFIAIYVELFFILTGFFAMKHVTGAHSGSESTVSFLLAKAKTFYLPLCLANVVQLVINCCMNHVSTLGGVLERLWHFKWEFLLLQCAGFIQNPQFNNDYLIGPAWFLSAMLLALAVIYPLTKYFRRIYVSIIAPVSILFIYTGFTQAYGTLNVGNGSLFVIMDAPLRAFAGISVGMLVYEAFCMLQTRTRADGFKLKGVYVLIDTCCWAMLPISIAIGVMGNDHSGLFMVPVFAEIVISSMLGITPVPRLLNKIPSSISGFMGKMSLFIYLAQWSAIVVVMQWLPLLEPGMKMAAAAVITVIYGFVLYIVDAAYHKRRTLRT